MPATTALMVENLGDTATSVPSDALSLNLYVSSSAVMISNVPAKFQPFRMLRHCSAPPAGKINPQAKLTLFVRD
jgi:hypothetical protein